MQGVDLPPIVYRGPMKRCLYLPEDASAWCRRRL